jgi:soluble lytic murein transglycosylase-like protein
MPATAAGLGVDPTDLSGNVQGGISYLNQLYQQFGDWATALAAYNWGPGNVSKSGGSIPSSVAAYVAKVLGLAGTSSPVAPPASADVAIDSMDTSAADASVVSDVSPTVWLVAGLAGLGLVLWWIEG